MFSFHFVALRLIKSVTSVLYLPHYCFLEAENLFPDFIGPQMERNFASGLIIPRLSPILIKLFGCYNLEHLNQWYLDEILNYELVV